jgi:type VI secretion system protein ImpK
MYPQLQGADGSDEPAGMDQRPSGPERLALLYQGLLIGVVRVKSQRQRISDAEAFRRRTRATLQEVERLAIAGGYVGDDVRNTHFAVVAFIDAVLLNSKDAVAAEWGRKSLQQEMFGQTDAGVVFFEKLERFRARRDSERLADILEVYLLCLLLGFEGRYSGGRRAELDAIADDLRRRIEEIRTRLGRSAQPGALSAPVPAPSPKPPQRDILRLVTFAALVLTILCYLLCRWNLVQVSEGVVSRPL